MTAITVPDLTGGDKSALGGEEETLTVKCNYKISVKNKHK